MAKWTECTWVDLEPARWKLKPMRVMWSAISDPTDWNPPYVLKVDLDELVGIEDYHAPEKWPA